MAHNKNNFQGIIFRAVSFNINEEFDHNLHIACLDPVHDQGSSNQVSEGLEPRLAHSCRSLSQFL